MSKTLKKQDFRVRDSQKDFEDLLSDIVLPGSVVWSGERDMDDTEEQQGDKGQDSKGDSKGKEGEEGEEGKGGRKKEGKRSKKDKGNKKGGDIDERGGDGDERGGDGDERGGDGDERGGDGDERGGDGDERGGDGDERGGDGDDGDEKEGGGKGGGRKRGDRKGSDGKGGGGRPVKGRGELLEPPRLPREPASPDKDDEQKEIETKDNDDITIDDILRGRKKKKPETISKLPEDTKPLAPEVVEPIHLDELYILGKEAAEVLNDSSFGGLPSNIGLIATLQSFAPNLWDIVTYTILNKIKTEANILKNSKEGAIKSFTLEELQSIVSREQNLTQATLIESLLGAGLSDEQSQIISENVIAYDYIPKEKPISTYPILLLGLDNSGSMHDSIHLGEQYIKDFKDAFIKELFFIIEKYIKEGQAPKSFDDIDKTAETIASEIKRKLLHVSEEIISKNQNIQDKDLSNNIAYFLEVMNKYIQASVWANLPYLLPDDLMEGFISAVCNIAQFDQNLVSAIMPIPSASSDDPKKSSMYLTQSLVQNSSNKEIVNEKRGVLAGGNHASFHVGLYYGCLARIIIISTILKNLELNSLLSDDPAKGLKLSENDIEIINFIFSVMHVTDYFYAVNGFINGFYEGLLKEPELSTGKWVGADIAISNYREVAYRSIGWLSKDDSEKQKFIKILEKFLHKIKILPASNLLYKVVLDDFDGDQKQQTVLALIMPSLANYLVLRNIETNFIGETSSPAIAKKEVDYASNINDNRSYQILETTEITKPLQVRDVLGRVINSFYIIDLTPESLANLLAWIIAYFSYTNKDAISKYRELMKQDSNEIEQIRGRQSLGQSINFTLEKIREAASTMGNSNESIYKGLMNALFTNAYNVMYRLNNLGNVANREIGDFLRSHKELEYQSGLNNLQKVVWALLKQEYRSVGMPVHESQVSSAAASSDMRDFKAIVTMPNPNLLRGGIK